MLIIQEGCKERRLSLTRGNRMKKEEICRIIEKKDDKHIKSAVMSLLQDFIKGKKPVDDIIFFPNCLESVPLELGWDKPYTVKDEVLTQVLGVMSGFDELDERDAKERAQEMLNILRIK